MAQKKSKNNNLNTKKLYAALCAVLVVLLVLIGISVYTIVRDKSPAKTAQSEVEKAIEALDIKQNPVVTIEMENGSVIKAELYPETAPNTVCNFIELANSGFYDGTIFHRCIKGFMIQGGDPEGTGMGGPGYSIAGEFSNNGFSNDLKHERGVLSMARSTAYNSGGSQFFIMVDTSSYLDGDYAAFGKVTEGMDVVDEIVANETDSNDKPITPQVMKKVSVETFGVNYPEAEKIK